jgi:hypothetical protein
LGRQVNITQYIEKRKNSVTQERIGDESGSNHHEHGRYCEMKEMYSQDFVSAIFAGYVHTAQNGGTY